MSSTAASTGASTAGNASTEATANVYVSSQDSPTMELDIAAATSFIEETQVSLTKRLRDQFPFLATAALDKLVEDATKALRDGLEEARPAMVASKGRSNFFKLPPELRNRILGDVLEESPLFLAASLCHLHGTCVTLPGETFNARSYASLAAKQTWGCKHLSECVDSDCASKCEPRSHQRLVKPPGLLQICRKLRAEVAPMFFGGKTFHFEVFNLQDGSWLKDWLKVIGVENASLIDKIHVVVAEAHIDVYLRELNWKARYKKAVKRGKKYKEVWGKKGLLGSLGLLGLGVRFERFEFSSRREFWGDVEITPWEQDVKPDYSAYYAPF